MGGKKDILDWAESPGKQPTANVVIIAAVLGRWVFSFIIKSAINLHDNISQ